MSSSTPRLSTDVRRAFLDFFGRNGHKEVASSSLVPQDDPTLLFANAGMNQFKDYFTGKREVVFKRATSSQKCVRAGGKHNDLENVGRTARHHTFFEMLGNFSFGDYFKADAIAFAHQLLTKDLAIDPKRLVYTVHHSDDEARQLWKKVTGVGDDRVISLGDKDNFWAMGETGPCGPCSELHYRQGADSEIPCPVEAAGGKCEGPACDCDRWVEIWNLVFMQFEQVAPGDRRPLPRPSVDTGMGLERLCAVLQGVRSNYETDLLKPLIDHAAQLSGTTFVPSDYQGASVSLRAIADHARAAAFLIADGVFPDKTGREYVLRRIMRRAVYHGWLLGVKEPFFAALAGDVVANMGASGVYRELTERASLIKKICTEEEVRFRETLERGMAILLEQMGKGAGKKVPGDLAFKLYDTYGFPLDLTRVIAQQKGATVDEQGFEKAMAEQRARSEFQGSGEAAVEAVFQKIADRVGPSKFLGYHATTGSSKVVALVADGAEVESVGPFSKRVAVVTEETPFYGEQGGQIGDSGAITSPRAKLNVTDVKRPVATLWVHHADVIEGELRVGDAIELTVDAERRDAIRRNHSATHLLHWALRQVLGEHVTQKGSLVAPDRLRFDFSHFAPLTPDEKRKVEGLVNARIRANAATDTQVLPIADARKAGAIAFFGEKYGDTVRVVSMAESKEFCGGTHVARTGDIAFFLLTSEGGVAQGVRRLEAVTGEGALSQAWRLQDELGHAGEVLAAGAFEVAAKAAKLQDGLRERDKEIERLKRKLADSSSAGPQASDETELPGGRFIVRQTSVADPKTLRDLGDKLRDQHRDKPTLALIVGAEGDKVLLITVSTAPDLYDAGKVAGVAAKVLGGKGGGKPQLGQGGGTSLERLAEAKSAVVEMFKGGVGG
jgi:alanyl-tRNA synthetase